MSDSYEQFRSLSLASVAPLLGIDLSRFKKRKGGELYGPCPIHHPKANQTSFSYSADGKFFCFSCSAKGRGAIDLAMQVLHIGFKEAVERLGGVKAQPQPQSEPISDSGASEGHSTLQPLKSSYHKFKEESPWLAARIPSPEVLERYQVFAYHNPARKSAYSHKVMIPLRGFEVGAHELKDGAPHKLVYLVESPLCVMKFACMGLKAVSPFGWSVSDEQLGILQALAKGIIYLPDRNKYEDGKSVAATLAGKLWVKYPELPEGIDDPEGLTLEQIQAL